MDNPNQEKDKNQRGINNFGRLRLMIRGGCDNVSLKGEKTKSGGTYYQ